MTHDQAGFRMTGNSAGLRFPSFVFAIYEEDCLKIARIEDVVPDTAHATPIASTKRFQATCL